MSRRSSIISSSQRKSDGRPHDGGKDDIVSAATETSGDVFDDSIIELIRNAETGYPNLLLCKDKIRTSGSRIKHRGKIFVPPALEASLLRSLTLPVGTTDYGSTGKLFDAANSIFLKADFSSEVSETASFFVFSSWFPDLLPHAPCLLIRGSRSEALHLLQILACLVRRPLPLTPAPNITALASLLPNGLAPTLLINAETLPPEKLILWLSTAGRSSNVIAGSRVVNFCTARAIFVGEALDAVPLEESVFIADVEPSETSLPTISSHAQAKLASEFQPLLLEYRLRNFDEVRRSMFDFPGNPAALRIAARVLGAPIVEAPGLQELARGILKRQRQMHEKQLWLDARVVVIEAALARCHDPKATEIRVAELTADVVALFATRGQERDIDPRKVGAILTTIGISRERLRDGYTVQFTHETRQKLHRLARLNGIPVTEQRAAKCPKCLASITGQGPSDAAKTNRG